jgi:DNA-binding MarR family transcriptional regulator
VVRRWQRNKSDAQICPKWSDCEMSEQLHYSAPSKSVAILCSQPVRTKQFEQLALACGCRLSPLNTGADYLLTDISSVSDRPEQECSEIADYLNRYGAEALVWIGMHQLESAYAALPPERCHWLVDADDALAVPILARANRRGDMDQLHDRSREGEYGALHKISDDLADFARTLARIAEQDDNGGSSVRDKPVSFRPASAAMFEPLVPPPDKVTTPTAAKVRELIKLRRLRDQHFPPDLFADPAWDILLDLYAANLEGKSVSVSSLCIAAAVPPTTALRWITTMTEHKALVRKQDPNDARRVFIGLSEDSEERLAAYFASVAARGGFPI